jgi:hypothetical protein
MTFEEIPASEVHPVTRYGYDPIPGNRGHYAWDEETRTYYPIGGTKWQATQQ